VAARGARAAERAAAATARAVGISIEVIEVRDLGNLDAVAAQVMRANVQGLLVGAAPFWIQGRTEVAAMAARLKLPAVYSWRASSQMRAV
jgi:hypothetical protein